MANPPELISQMLQPGFYPHSVVEPIQLVQTHISYVFLTGEYAYKVKKDVNLNFLNYSTLDQRKFYIEAELKLNQQISPELYLAVLPISNYGNNFILNDPSNIVEYALKMHQFEQDNLFSNLLANNQLSLADLAKLGRIVALFHQQAKTNDRIARFGRVENIRIAINENYQQTQKYLGKVQTLENFLAIKHYTDNFFKQNKQLFQTRINQHKIRECHGDLHLKNICLWRQKIQLFDRIEFNESFRFVDTMYDVAFTTMDLETQGKADLANIFLNSYLEHTGDWEGLLILPFYLCRQAYVRAKVTSFLLDDLEISNSEQQQAQQTAYQYYRQAYKYTQPKSGCLILMSGLSGSGKSTVAKTLAQNINAIQIRSDAVRKHLAGIALDKPGMNSIYTNEMNHKTYERLFELGMMLVEAGYKVILDAKYDRYALRQPIITQAQAENIPLRIIHCIAPMSILRDRLNKRQNDISDATAKLLDNQQKNMEAFTVQEQNYVITVDTSSDDEVKSGLDWLISSF